MFSSMNKVMLVKNVVLDDSFVDYTINFWMPVIAACFDAFDQETKSGTQGFLYNPLSGKF
jgi:hypothetical protein